MAETTARRALETFYIRIVELEQEVIRLKDLNREMVEALKDIYYQTRATDRDDWSKVQNILVIAEQALQKARGEGE